MSRNVYARLAVATLAQDGILKIVRHPESPIAFIGAAELLCVALCLIPRTSLAGAALFTVYLIVATATGALTWLDFALGLALLPVIWLGPDPRKQLDLLAGALPNIQHPTSNIRLYAASRKTSSPTLATFTDFATPSACSSRICSHVISSSYQASPCRAEVGCAW
jgi:hypothetical protein